MTATLTRPELDTTPLPAATRPGIPFQRLLRVEWQKTTDTRASRWLIGLMALSIVGLMIAPILATGSFKQNGDDYLAFAGFAVSLLLPVLTVLVMTSEWSQRTVLTTFTQEPRRGRVIAAKIGAAGILTALTCVFAALVTVAALASSAATGTHVSWHLSPSVAIGFVVVAVLNAAMGVGFGAVLQNTAAAIVMIFALPTVFALLSAPLGSVADWISPARMLDWVSSGEWGGHAPQILVGIALWFVLPVAAGIVRTMKREIN